MDKPLRPLVSAWIEKIRLAMDHKRKKFQDDANEAAFFFHGPYDELFGPRRNQYGRGFVPPDDVEDFPRPAFAMTVNKVAELVQLFGPTLYHKNPTRQVNPRKPPLVPIELMGDPNDPNVQMMYQGLMQQVGQERALDRTRALLLEQYLNYTPTALDLKTESRWAIDEGLIKGMGILWCEVYKPAGAPWKMVGSFFDSVDNLALDPDMESIRDAKWIAKRCIHPIWEIEKEYGLPPGTLKGNLESFDQQAQTNTDQDGNYNRKRGLTNDLVVYWKIWSKMGLGGRLRGATPGSADVSPLRDAVEVYGDYCYLVVAEHLPFPLNLPDEVVNTAPDQEIQQRVAWPTPFWADDAWPFTPIAFHWVPREIWPMSHIRPAMGELKFLQWAYSMLAGKVRVACRDFIAIAKSSSEELKDQIKVGQDYTMIEIEALHGSIDAVVKFLQHPNFNLDVYKVIQAVEHNFEKRTGLTELMYGSSPHQFRSAAESDAKVNMATIRPDDMANKVEDAMSEVARKEALAARWHLDQNDIAPILGPIGAQWWGQFVMPSDPSEVIHQLEYRIEAGSSKKPNKERDAANMNQAMQTLFQPLYQYATATGNVGPVNALMSDWAKSIDMDPSKYLLSPPPPPPPMPGPAGESPGSPGSSPAHQANGAPPRNAVPVGGPPR